MAIVVTKLSIFKKYPDCKLLQRIAAREYFFCLRDRVEELFTHIDGFQDKEFGIELDSAPHERIWEMIVAKIVSENGLKLVQRSLKKGPDFLINVGQKRLWIEAICANYGDPEKPDALMPLTPGEFRESPMKEMLLRVTSALDQKSKKFKHYREIGLVKPDDQCVIAITSSQIEGWGSLPYLGLRATLAMGDLTFVFNPRTKEQTQHFAYQPEITKRTGNETIKICTRPFLDPDWSHISGLLYSDTNFFSSKFEPLKDSRFIHNPRADSPCGEWLFPRLPEHWTILCTDEEVWTTFERSPRHTIEGSNHKLR